MKDNYEFKGFSNKMPNSKTWAGLINQYATQYKLDPNFVASEIMTESSFVDLKTPNGAGAVGIGQFTKVIYDKYPDYYHGTVANQIKDICDWLHQLSLEPNVLGYSGEDKISCLYIGTGGNEHVKYIANIHKNKADIEKNADGLIGKPDGKKAEVGKSDNRVNISTLPFSNAITKWSTLIGASLFGGFLILLWLGNSSLKNETL